MHDPDLHAPGQRALFNSPESLDVGRIELGRVVNYPIPAQPDAFRGTLGHERSFLARLNGPLEANETGFRAHYRGMGVVWLN